MKTWRHLAILKLGTIANEPYSKDRLTQNSDPTQNIKKQSYQNHRENQPQTNTPYRNKLVGGFKYLLLSPQTLGFHDPIWQFAYFSNMLVPPPPSRKTPSHGTPQTFVVSSFSQAGNASMRTNNADNRWSALITSAQVQHLGCKILGIVDVGRCHRKTETGEGNNVAKSSLVLNESAIAIYNDRIFRNFEWTMRRFQGSVKGCMFIMMKKITILRSLLLWLLLLLLLLLLLIVASNKDDSHPINYDEFDGADVDMLFKTIP